MDALEDVSPDLILVDMKMPGMNGLDVLREIKSREISCLPIMMTAYGELEIANEAMGLGVKYFINKPFDIDDLRKVEKMFWRKVTCRVQAGMTPEGCANRSKGI